MTAMIVRRPAPSYVADMRQALAKLLLMLAVLAMPFSMAAPAAAAAQHSTQAMAEMPMQHCPGTGGGQPAKGGTAECTMACSAALPAIAAVAPLPVRHVAAPTPRTLAEPLAGLHPETATPPPRNS